MIIGVESIVSGVTLMQSLCTDTVVIAALKMFLVILVIKGLDHSGSQIYSIWSANILSSSEICGQNFFLDVEMKSKL